LLDSLLQEIILLKMLSSSRSLVVLLGKSVTKLSTRNTVIVKRVHKPPLVAPNTGSGRVSQKKIDESVIHTDEDKYMVYQVEQEYHPFTTVKLILLKNVERYGIKGQIISPGSVNANRDLLLTGLAVYHNQENLEKYSDIIIPEDTKLYSSETAEQMARRWRAKNVAVSMSMETPWTMEKWHIIASLRKYRLWVTEDQIEIPGGQITGPDLNMNYKEFIVILTVNDFDKIKLRCSINLVSKYADKNRINPYWYCNLEDPVWEHERQELYDMPRRAVPLRMRNDKNFAEKVEAYDQWKADRLKKLMES
jgi:ribosomal protein L9